MTKKEVVEYRKYQLVARLHQGKFKGRVYDLKDKMLTEIEGTSIDAVLKSLKEYVDKIYIDKADGRTSSPEASEYVQAFQKILEGLPDSYVAMLKANFRAPNRTITATQLAEAGGYKSWHAANLHYGLLGLKLYEELPIQLPRHPNGRFIYTFTLATEGDLSKDESQWHWTMRPEVADAIGQLGLVK